MTAPQSRMSKASSRRICLALGVLVAAMISAVGYSLYSGNKATQTYAPLMDAAMEIKLEAAIGHLWFEEILSGDRHESIETVWGHLDQSAWYARAMLDGGVNEEGTFIPLADAALRYEIEQVCGKISQLRTVAEERYAARETSVAGTDIDQQFDAVFHDFLAQADGVETSLQALMHRARLRSLAMQSALIAACLTLGVIVAVVFRNDRRRLLAALREADEQTAGRQRAVEDLQESEEKYRSLTEDTPVMICRFLPDGEITYVNKAYCDCFDQTPDTLVGRSFLSLIPEQDREGVMANIKALTADSPMDEHQHRVLMPDGNTGWQRWTNRALFDAAGEVSTYQATGEDITARKLAEEERDGPARFPSENPNPVLRISKDGTVLYSNAAGKRVLDAWGGSQSQRVPARWQGIVSRALARQAPAFEEEAENDRTWSFVISPIPHTDYVNLYASDITELKQIQKDLEQRVTARTTELQERSARSETLNKAMVNLLEDMRDAHHRLEVTTAELNATNHELEAFTYSVSHDLRAPLRAVDGFSQVLIEDYGTKLDADGLEHLRYLREASQEMGQLIDDLLALSRTSREPIEKVKVDLGDVAKSVVDDLCKQSPDRDVAFATTGALDAEADPRLMRVVLVNLLTNAWKFTGQTDAPSIESAVLILTSGTLS